MRARTALSSSSSAARSVAASAASSFRFDHPRPPIFESSGSSPPAADVLLDEVDLRGRDVQMEPVLELEHEEVLLGAAALDPIEPEEPRDPVHDVHDVVALLEVEERVERPALRQRGSPSSRATAGARSTAKSSWCETAAIPMSGDAEALRERAVERRVRALRQASRLLGSVGASSAAKKDSRSCAASKPRR